MDFHIKVIELKEQGLGLKAIAKILHKCTDTIREELVLSGHMSAEKKKGGRKRKYTINDSFFKSLDEKGAYILGFIFADGCIHEKRNQLSITVDSKDEILLNQISDYLNSNFPIVKYFARYDDKHKFTEKSKFQITSTQILSDLNVFGCIARKSDVLKFPENIPNNLIHHFMRGYFDGDGTIFISARNEIVFGIISTFEFCDKYLKQLPYDGKTTAKKEKRSNKNVFYISISGTNKVKKIYDFLYKDSTVYLERKRRIFEDFFIKKNI